MELIFGLDDDLFVMLIHLACVTGGGCTHIRTLLYIRRHVLTQIHTRVQACIQSRSSYCGKQLNLTIPPLSTARPV